MNDSYREYLASARGHDLGDYIDLIVRKADGANAFGTALVGKPEPQSTVRLGPSGDHRLSQVSTEREARPVQQTRATNND
jgi:hypothetical protein